MVLAKKSEKLNFKLLLKVYKNEWNDFKNCSCERIIFGSLFFLCS
jgi:hypothetical protein